MRSQATHLPKSWQDHLQMGLATREYPWLCQIHNLAATGEPKLLRHLCGLVPHVMQSYFIRFNLMIPAIPV